MKNLSDLSAMANRALDATEGLLQKRGYGGFSMDDIATLIGIKKPSLFHHFSTKAELVAFVVLRYTNKFREELLRIKGALPTAPERLVAYNELFTRTFQNERRLCVCGMLGAESDSLPGDVTDAVERFFRVNLDWLSEVMADGQQAGSVRQKQSALDLASAFLASLEGSMVLGRGMRSAQGPAEVGRTWLSVALS